MSNSVDDEIVSMKFENTQFLSGVTASLNALARLKESMNFSATGKGLSDVQGAINKVNTNPLIDSAGGISKAFLAASTIAVTAIATITAEAVRSAGRIASTFTSAPILDGFHEYETQLGSIQTVLANTGLEGQKGLDKVNQALGQLNTYSDKTIYNFGEMAKNVGTFTAAGVDLDTSVGAIKGIANLAALSGSTSAQAATGMYQLSQAISTGTVRLMDWNSVQTAGFGGKIFQDAIKETARAHGVAVDEMIKENGSFRDSLQEGWFSSEILTETLSKFTGDLTMKQLKSMGYTEQQSKDILKQAKVAQDAATKVKTLTQLTGTLKEAIGSGWSRTFSLVFGDFNEAKGLFTGINNVLSGAIGNSAKARNKVLGQWKKLGGRDLLLSGMGKAFDAVLDLISPIQKAFRDIFPRQTGKDLFELTQRFFDFAESLSLNETTMDNIRRTARGFFAVLDIGWQIVKGVFGVFGDLFGAMGDGSGNFLEFTGTIGDWLVKLDEAIKKGDGLTKFFDTLGSVLSTPIRLLSTLTGYVLDLFDGFDGFDTGKVSDGLDKVGEALSPLERLFNIVHAAWDGLIGVFRGAGSILAPVIEVFDSLGSKLADSISEGDFSGVLDAINTGLLAGIILLLRNFMKRGLKLDVGQGGLFSSIKNGFDSLTGSLEAMQANIQASTLLKIAGAVALMTASMVALSLIDSEDLTKALAAITVGMGQLLLGMKLLTEATSEVGFIKMPLMAASMVLLAGAILVLSGAVVVLSKLSWEELLKGLSGVIVLMVALAGTASLMSGATGPILRMGLAMVPLAIAVTMLAGAVKLFSLFSWEDMAKGMTGVAGALLIIAGAMQLMPKNLPITAAGLVLVGVGLTSIAGAVLVFATMSWKDMEKGAAALAGALLIIAGAMQLMPANLPITAAGLILVGIALAEIAGVAKIFASMSWEDLGKAAAALAGSLLIIAGGLYLMSGTLLGSAALLVAAGALAILAPVLVTLGAMSWTSIVKGLTTLAGAFVILGLAGLLLTPIVLPLLGLGAAMTLIGAGMALAGVGALAFATAFAIFTAAGTAGLAVVAGLIALVPEFATAFAQAVVNFAVALADNGGQLIDAWVKLLGKLLDGVVKIIPKIGKVIVTLVKTAAKVLIKTAPALAEAGVAMLLALLTALRNHIDDIADVAGDLITRFIRALGRQALKIQDAAAQTIIDFINGTADAIREYAPELGEAGANLALAIIQGMVTGLWAGVSAVTDAAKGVAQGALDGALHLLGIKSPSKEFYKIGRYVDEGFRDGIVGGSDEVTGAMEKLTGQLRDSVSKMNGEINDEQKKLEKLLKAPEKNAAAIKKVKATLEDLKAMRNASKDALKELNKGLKKERGDLEVLSKQYDKVSNQLADASAALKQAQDDFDAVQKNVSSSFGSKPDIAENESLAEYLKQAGAQTGDVEKFLATLEQLRAAGLSDESYQQLLDEGVDAQRLMDQLLAGGGGAVQAFNETNAALAAAAQRLGTTAAVELKQAGVDAAQGLVNGFKSQRDNLEAEMGEIARIMVRAIKKALKIKSPSRAFAEVGEFSNKGLVEGLQSTSGAVEKASAAVGDLALDTLKVSMSKVKDAISGTVNLDPVITPILDLTQLQQDASRIGTLLTTNPLQAEVSYSQAARISADTQARQAVDLTPAPAPEVRDVSFVQNNYSPKAIDAVETYRNTNNLISLKKEALDI